MSDLTPEIIEARKKMAEKFGNLKLGGKGTEKRKKINRWAANSKISIDNLLL